MKNLEFYKCDNCDKIVAKFDTNKICGKNKKIITPNTVDAAKEKHVPVVTFNDEYIKVEVGSVLHPMSKEHLISNIYVVTDKGLYIQKELTENDKPEYTFKIDDANEVDVYALCNLHGVWKTSAKRD